MLGDTLFDDILDALAESADTSRPIFDMLWEDSSFLGMLQNSTPGLTWNPMGVFGDSESNLTSLAPTSYGTHSLEAESSIIHAMTGIEASREELLKETITRGWYNNGILPEHLGKALSLYDIAYHVNENGTTVDIMRELVYGRKMIVALDMKEFLSNDPRFMGRGVTNVKETISDMLGMRTCDQAIWITDVDSSDPNDIKIVINDTTVAGTSEKIYALSDFEETWDDTGFHYVATDTAPADLEATAIGFDPATGTFAEAAAYFESRFEGFLDDTPPPLADSQNFEHLIGDVHRDPTFAQGLGAGEVKLIRAIYNTCQQLIPEVSAFITNSVNFKVLVRLAVRLSDNAANVINRLLEDDAQKVEAQGVRNATAADLTEAFAENPEMLIFFDTGTDALGVGVVDMSDPTMPQIIVNASGNPNYAEQIYSFENFTEAWSDVLLFHYVRVTYGNVSLINN